VVALAFSHDSRRLATGSVAQDWQADAKSFSAGLGEARVYEVAGGRQLGRTVPHPLAVIALAFSPDDRLLLTGCEDGNARLFSVACGDAVGGPLANEGAVMSLAFAPDGRTAVTASAGGYQGAAARLWELPAEAAPRQHLPARAMPRGTWDSALVFSPAGDVLVTGSTGDPAIRRWDVASGKPVGAPWPLPQAVLRLASSRDGGTLAGTGTDANLRLWDRSGTLRHVLAHDSQPHLVAVSPDGKAALSETGPGVVRLWNAATGELRATVPHRGIIRALALPDADRALWLEQDGTSGCRLWAKTGADDVRRLWEQPVAAVLACFDAAGRALVVVGEDGCPRLLDAATGRPFGPALPHDPCPVAAVVLADDARTALIGDADGNARLWDMVLARPLGPPLRHPGRVTALAFSPAGNLLAVMNGGGAYVWPMPEPVTGSPEEVRVRTEALTGLKLGPDGVARERPTLR
jgi:WD40 repeat protein